MSPTQFPEQQHAKREMNGSGNGTCPCPLNISKDSYFIKKSASPLPASSSSFSTSSLAKGVAAPTKPQQRHPVIIYTHSPKVIHTHPRDFMALVQKLTGLSRSDDDQPRPKQEPGGETLEEERNKSHKAAAHDDTESSSVITEENCSSTVVGDVQINSCFANPPIFDPPINPCFNNLPLFTLNSSDFLCSAQPFYYNYADSLFLVPNMRSSISSSSTLDGMKEFREF